MCKCVHIQSYQYSYVSPLCIIEEFFYLLYSTFVPSPYIHTYISNLLEPPTSAALVLVPYLQRASVSR